MVFENFWKVYKKRLFLSIFYQTERGGESRAWLLRQRWCSRGCRSGAEHFYMDICIKGMWFLQENDKKTERKKPFTSCRTHSVHDQLATHQEEKKNTYQKCTRLNNKVYCIQIILTSSCLLEHVGFRLSPLFLSAGRCRVKDSCCVSPRMRMQEGLRGCAASTQ